MPLTNTSALTRRVLTALRDRAYAGHLPLAAAVLVAGALIVSGVDAVAGPTRAAGLERAAMAAAEAETRGGAGPASAASVPEPLRLTQPSTTAQAAKPAAAAATKRAALPKTTTPEPGPLPVGKGMWIWQPDKANGGNARSIVRQARQYNLTHIYVRTGSSWQGFHGAAFLRELLPIAHRAGIRVYGWDFPNLEDVRADIRRAGQAVRFEAPGGHRIDGFVPDLETPSEGTASTKRRVAVYADWLRRMVGENYPLIACVPRPSKHLLKTGWPYAEAIGPMDAVAPMVYWLNRQPDSDVTGAVNYLERFGKPVIPVGQAYDGGPEGGRPGPPPAHEIRRFIRAAAHSGATGVSFWSWQHATPAHWRAIRDSKHFSGDRPGKPAVYRETIAKMQRALSRLGYPVVATGYWDTATVTALEEYQEDNRLPRTGRLDRRTAEALYADGAPVPAKLR